MKNTLSKLVLAGALLAATLSAASAATRHHMRVNDDAGYTSAGSFSNTATNQYSDDEQRRRDIGGQGG